MIKKNDNLTYFNVPIVHIFRIENSHQSKLQHYQSFKMKTNQKKTTKNNNQSFN